MKKKQVPLLNKQRAAAAPKPNPFELKGSKRKFDVLGRRKTGDKKNVVQARQQAVEKVCRDAGDEGAEEVEPGWRQRGVLAAAMQHHAHSGTPGAPDSLDRLLFQSAMCTCSVVPDVLAHVHPPTGVSSPCMQHQLFAHPSHDSHVYCRPMHDSHNLQRKKTLLVEYRQLRKANTFIDRRFGGGVSRQHGRSL
jgi:hypothetical protein